MISLGGSAINGGAFGPVNEFSTYAIAVQQDQWAETCRKHADKKGIQLLLQERVDEGPAISIVRAKEAGESTISHQRMGPPTLSELTPEMRRVLASASAVIVGPLRSGPETTALLQAVPELAPRAFLALVPHPSFIEDPLFPLIAPSFHYVQMNAEESRFIDGAASAIPLRARRLAFLLGNDRECAVTNGSQRGYFFACQWFTIDPPTPTVVDEVACGDSFCAAYVVGRALLGLPPEEALRYAVDAAAATATQVGLSDPLPYVPPEGLRRFVPQKRLQSLKEDCTAEESGCPT